MSRQVEKTPLAPYVSGLTLDVDRADLELGSLGDRVVAGAGEVVHRDVVEAEAADQVILRPPIRSVVGREPDLLH